MAGLKLESVMGHIVLPLVKGTADKKGGDNFPTAMELIKGPD